MTLLKINRLLPIYISIVLLKFEVDIQSQSKVRVWKPKNRWNQYMLLPMATINMHMKFEIEILKQTWLMLRKPCRLQTDVQTDGLTRWIQYTPPPTSLLWHSISIWPEWSVYAAGTTQWKDQSGSQWLKLVTLDYAQKYALMWFSRLNQLKWHHQIWLEITDFLTNKAN